MNSLKPPLLLPKAASSKRYRYWIYLRILAVPTKQQEFNLNKGPPTPTLLIFVCFSVDCSNYWPNSNVADPRCLSRIRIKEFKYFNPKKLDLSSRKYDSGCSSRIRILSFYPFRIRGSKRHRIPDPQHCLPRDLPGVALLCFGEDLSGGTALCSLPQLMLKLLAESSLQIQTSLEGKKVIFQDSISINRSGSVWNGRILDMSYKIRVFDKTRFNFSTGFYGFHLERYT